MKKLALVIVFIFWFIFSLEAKASSIFDTDTSNTVLYCNDSQSCWLNKWTDIVKNNIDWIATDQKLSDFIQNTVAYLLTFISIIAVIYIIYAWFSILISGWSDDVQKKQKKTIISIVIWIIIIRLSYTIVTFIIWIAQHWTPTT